VSCEPFCPTTSIGVIDDGGGDGGPSPVTLIVGSVAAVIVCGLIALCALVIVPRYRARQATVKVNMALASRSAVNASVAAFLEQSAAPAAFVHTVANTSFELSVPGRTNPMYDVVDPETNNANKVVYPRCVSLLNCAFIALR